MERTVSHQRGQERRTGQDTAAPIDDVRVIRQRILENVSEVRILDPNLCRTLVRQRQSQDMDMHDEVWEGVYVVPAQPTNPHQALVGDLTTILITIIKREGLGFVYPGANVSDRRRGWEHNHRAPDVVVVLAGGSAVDCGTHWCGGPDFIVKVQSPGDATEEKLPFYSHVGVQELLIIHRDTRQLELYRHDGRQLVLAAPSRIKGQKWLVSAVVPLAFRRRSVRGSPRIDVRRTDRKAGKWTV